MKSSMAGTIRPSPHWNHIDGSDNYRRYPGWRGNGSKWGCRRMCRSL